MNASPKLPVALQLDFMVIINLLALQAGYIYHPTGHTFGLDGCFIVIVLKLHFLIHSFKRVAHGLNIGGVP